MAGRRAMPIELKVLRGKSNMTKAEIDARKKAEVKLKPKADNIKPPSWLDRDGKREWKRVAAELEALDLLTNVDVTALAVYCDAVSRYIEATKAIRDEGITVEYTNAAGATNTVANPNVAIARQYAQLIRQYLIEFGLSPSSRAKLAIPREDEPEETPEERLFGNV